MTTTKDLADRLAALEAKLTTPPPVPTQTAATDNYGNPGTVVAGELVESAWGNSVRDHVVRVFPDTAALNAWAAPDGALAEAPVGILWVRYLGTWKAYGSRLIDFVESTVNSGPYPSSGVYTVIPGLQTGVDGHPGRYYRATLVVPWIRYDSGVGAFGDAVVAIFAGEAILNSARFSHISDGDGGTLTTTAMFSHTGTVTITARATMDGPVGTVYINANTGQRCVLTLEDIGGITQ